MIRNRPRRRAARGTAVLTSALAGAMAACGGSASSSPAASATVSGTGTATGTATGASPTASPGATLTASATPAPSPALELLWVVQVGSHKVVRRATPGSPGSGTTVATLPDNAFFLTAGHGRLLYSAPGGVLAVISTTSGAMLATGHYTGDEAFGAAMSPDGSHAAFLDAKSGGGTLKTIDLTSGAVATIAALGSTPVPAPTVWVGAILTGLQIVPNSGAGVQGIVRLDASTGAPVTTTPTNGAAAVVPTSDGLHGVVTTHSALGDDADAQPGPGPMGPFNTLERVTIGSAPVILLKEAHHTITPLATSPDGSLVLIGDQGAAGGFAGISSSPDFGLLLISGAAKSQYRHEDGTLYDAGTFYQDGSTVAVASHDATGEALAEYRPAGATLVTLDKVAGGTSASVYLVPG